MGISDTTAWLIWFVTNGGIILGLHYAMTADVTGIMVGIMIVIWIVSFLSLPLLDKTIILEVMLKGGLKAPTNRIIMILVDLCLVFMLVLASGGSAVPWMYYLTAFVYSMAMFIQQRAYSIADEIREKLRD